MAFHGKFSPINVKLLLGTFDFDFDQGHIYMKGTNKPVPERVNTRPDGREYLTVRFNGRAYLKHRLLYAAAYREDPGADYIVHINHESQKDNRRWNLARMSPSEFNRYHCRKARAPRKEQSKLVGVHYHSTTARWRFVRRGKQLFSDRDKRKVERFAKAYAAA
jgi:hypothetical protein